MKYRAFTCGLNTKGLKYAENDVNLISSALIQQGYEIEHFDASYNLNESIASFCDSASNNDTIIIYFSGHGYVKSGKYYLVLKEDLENFSSSTIHIENILTYLENCKAKNKILILDSCSSAIANKYNPNWSNSLKILASSDVDISSKELEAYEASFFSWILAKVLRRESLAGEPLDYFNTISGLFNQLLKSINLYNELNNSNFPSPKLHGEHSIDFVIIQPVSILHNYLDEVIRCYDNCEEICFYPKSFCKVFKGNNTNYFVVPDIRYSKNNVSNLNSLKSLVEDTIGSLIVSNVLLLGDSGSGKTTACSYLYYLFAKACRSGESIYIPFFFALDDLQKKNNLNKTILELLNESYGFNFKVNEVNKLILNYRLLFILDGFDELSDRADYNKIIYNIKFIEQFYTSKSRVILTCRTHYFTNDKLINETMSGQFQQGTELLAKLESFRSHTICRLEEFTFAKIEEYIKIRKRSLAKELLDKIKSIYNLMDLAKKPLLLKLIVETLDELMRYNGSINRTSLYAAYTSFWIGREVERKMTDITREHKNEFITCIALSMWSLETTSMTEQELKTFINSPIGQSTILLDTNFTSADYDVRNCSFLNRDGDGNYKFMHRSFMEYFVGVKCISEINNVNSHLQSWNIQWFDQEVALFVLEIIQLPENSTKISLLAKIVENCNNKFLLWNALHILSLLEYNVFMNILGDEFLKILEAQANFETDIVIIRQYCRILAKFGDRDKAEYFIKKIISIAKNDSNENYNNNQTYIKYYQGQISACEALCRHLQQDALKYDALLHAYVLGQLGTEILLDTLTKIREKWKSNHTFSQVMTESIAIVSSRS